MCYSASVIVYGEERSGNVDLVYIGLTLLLTALSWGLIKLCEKL